MDLVHVSLRRLQASMTLLPATSTIPHALVCVCTACARVGLSCLGRREGNDVTLHCFVCRVSVGVVKSEEDIAKVR